MVDEINTLSVILAPIKFTPFTYSSALNELGHPDFGFLSVIEPVSLGFLIRFRMRGVLGASVMFPKLR